MSSVVAEEKKKRSHPPHYKLIYFNMIGRAEPARLMLVQSNIIFEDERIKFGDWPNEKHKYPFGQLPVLMVDDTMIAQSKAISRYLATVLGYAGKSLEESAKCDMLVDGLEDLLENKDFLAYFMESDQHIKEQMFANVMTKLIKPFLHRYEKFLKDNGGQFFVGSSLTWIDIALWIQLDYWQNKRFPGVLDDRDFLNLNSFEQTFLDRNPSIKDYVNNYRPTKRFSYFDTD